MYRVNHDNIVRWGEVIKKQFDRDNLHLTTPWKMESNKKTIKSIVSSISGLSSQLSTILRHQDLLLQKFQEIQMSMAEMHQLCLTYQQTVGTSLKKRSIDIDEIESGNLSPGFGSSPAKSKKSRLGLVYKSKSEKLTANRSKLVFIHQCV